MTQLAVTHCLRSEVQAGGSGHTRTGTVNFVAIDAHVRLMVTLILYHGGGKDLLSRVLGAIATCLFQMADDRTTAFSGRPFFRIIIGLLAELSPLETADETRLEYVQAIAGFLYATRPQRVPSFAFPWLQLVSDRRLMPPLLMAQDQAGWPVYVQLVLSQLEFLEPFLKNAELTDVVRLLYKGTLRLLLVLLHDFPEFLGQYHFRLCDAIPLSCVQMRNLVLSAFPRKMRLPDPFTGDLKLGTIPEVRYHPRMFPIMDNMFPTELANEIDMFIAGTKPILTVKDSLKKNMAGSTASAGMYNIPAVNAMIFYIGLKGMKARLDSQQKNSHVAAFNTPAIQLYAALIKDLDPEGRSIVVNAMANQLRYPNAHTQYFSFAILNLFENANDEKVQEQITRVLLERLIANRPHPWGLLVTFIELIKNPRYDLLNHSFTKLAPEIERLFESVAKSCTSKSSESSDL
jgi:CCR4-NOT transcription complex subunit 1